MASHPEVNDLVQGSMTSRGVNDLSSGSTGSVCSSTGSVGRSVGRLGRWDWAWAQAGSVGPIEWVGLGPKGPVQVIELKEGQTVTNKPHLQLYER